MAETTAQEKIWDEVLKLHIYELQHASNISKKVTDLLDKTEADLEAKILQKLKDFEPPLRTKDYLRLQELKEVLTALRAESWDKALELLIKSSNEIMNSDNKILSTVLQDVLPVQVSTILPAPELLASLVTTKPFQGKLLKEWVESISKADMSRMTNHIQVGMVQGETTPQIVKRIFGTRALNYRDGITGLTRNDIDAITKTAISSFTNAARQEFWLANKNIVEREQFVATLDSRTTPVCQGNDGKQFDVGKGPQPPLHIRCRSVRVPEFNLAYLSERPANPITEKQLIREYQAQNDIKGKLGRDNLPRGHKLSYDQFKRKRLRELVGPVPATETYQTWLTKQSISFQEDVLGITKAKLFREGGLQLDKFVDRTGGEFSLDELRSKYPNAFRKAGLTKQKVT